MKYSYKIILVLSIILNSYLIYKITLVKNDNDILKSALGICENNNLFSVEVFENTLLHKSKEDILKIIPNVKHQDIYKTKVGLEMLRKNNYKFEFKNDTLQAVYYNPR